MGALITLIDSALFFYFLIIAIVAPILDAQTVLHPDFFPDFLINLKHWYSHEYGDYLVMEKPDFFVGLVWVEILFQWPLSLINLYGIVSRKVWLNTTCLIYGVSCLTSMVCIWISFYFFIFTLFSFLFGSWENEISIFSLNMLNWVALYLH